MTKCIMSTGNDLYLPGESHQCERRGFFAVPGELGEYLVGGLVCKQHIQYLLKHSHEWVESFKKAGIPKGQRIEALQMFYTKQSIMAELH